MDPNVIADATSGTPGSTDGSLHGSILGTRVLRREDPELLTGAARYTADLPVGDIDGVLHAVFVPSPVAHGELGTVHVHDARATPGVVSVLTGNDLVAGLGIGAHHGFVKIGSRFARHPIAVDRVRFVGEPIALVVAETRTAAVDAAQTVWADIDPLPPVLDSADGEPAFLEISDPPLDLEAISTTVVRGTYVNQRIVVASMEPDACLADPGADGRLTLWASTQMPHLLHTQLADALGLDPAEVRIRTPRVGGGFGGKAGIHHEYTAVAAAARHLGRPVLWAPSRSEDMLAMPHGRAQVQWAEIGFDDDGCITGMRCRVLGDAGAYPTIGAALVGGTRRMTPGTYAVPATQVHAVSTATNTTPVGAYRGAGRPEATAMTERLMDQAARELGIDPVELRRRNLLPDTAFPYTTTTGVTYDSGAYALALDTAVDIVGYDALRAEQARRRDAGDTVHLGIGVACYVEITAGGSPEEFAAVTVHPDGSATVAAGTAAHGQGHATSYAMLVADATGIPLDRISHVDGDTDLVPRGGGTGGSRSLQLAGSAVVGATTALLDRARSLAAAMLEADPDDVVLDRAAGSFHVAGVPASAVGWADLAARAEADGDVLGADHVFTQPGATFPFGAHVAVVEVDTETGRVTLVRHVAVDDCGTVLNPVIVEGQQHGGIAAGVGQALYEEVRFDAAGTPITGNLADYGLPSAAEMPSFEVHSTETPSPLNPIGAKGIGEAATIGSTPAIQNAVIDAVAHLGVRHIDMPCTPETVWRAIAEPTDPWRPVPPVFAEVLARRDAAAATADPALDSAADGV
jgi:carbon-monoxide dehydrogenase large subunit